MKIAICLSGSMRNLEKSLKSIRHISETGDVKLFIHTWLFKDEQNLKKQRSFQKDGENFLFLFDNFDYESIHIDKFESKLDYFTYLKNIKNFKIRQYADKINHISMFYSIYISNNLKISFEKENNFLFDIVYRMRFDSEISNPNELVKQKIENNTIIIPTKEKDYGGINDQFAFGPSNAMDKYSNLFNNIENFNTYQNNPEQILKEYLKTQNIEIKRNNLYVLINHK
jgi:hypothetical protein